MKHPLVMIIGIYVLMIISLSMKIGFKETGDYAWLLMIGARGFYWFVGAVYKSSTK